MIRSFFRTSFLLLGLLQLTSAWATEGTDYVIQEGDHYPSPITVKIFRGTQMKFQALFDQSAQYEFSGSAEQDQSDINKLFGFSDCGDHHMENSARVGWRWLNGHLEAHAFIHKDGDFSSEFLGALEIGKSYSFSIGLSDDKTNYIFRLGQSSVRMPRGCHDSRATGYVLKPYFGGNQAAPHDIQIKIGYQDAYANFSVGLPFPNPTKNDFTNVKLNVPEAQNIGYRVFNTMGQLVRYVEPTFYDEDAQPQLVRVDFGDSIASGLYLVQFFARYDDGSEKPGMNQADGDAFKAITLK